ncbi:MAG: 2-oxoacid:acceptor oxidoreductase family protein, partial [Deltaproteobacteria bacterium]|nr:2-oxoacid:acceptor oxidoreductase family protein [Deltaproteobacteria bacterium]
MKEILWFGRGGQGVVLASQILAEAAFREGCRWILSAPAFGTERRGAPFSASTKLSEEPIRCLSQIVMADIAVVLDDSLFPLMAIAEKVKRGGTFIINTGRPLEKWDLNGAGSVAVIDAAAIARNQRLFNQGAPIVNTPILGAIARTTGLFSLDSL